MIKIVTTEVSAYFPIGQIKTMVYNRNKKKVKIIHIDDSEAECENVLMVYYNNEEI